MNLTNPPDTVGLVPPLALAQCMTRLFHERAAAFTGRCELTEAY